VNSERYFWKSGGGKICVTVPPLHILWDLSPCPVIYARSHVTSNKRLADVRIQLGQLRWWPGFWTVMLNEAKCLRLEPHSSMIVSHAVYLDYATVQCDELTVLWQPL